MQWNTILEISRCPLIRLTYEKKGTMSDVQVQGEFNSLRAEYVDYAFIYTDGSKTEEGVGCAYIHGNRSDGFKLPDHCSIFTAEAVAIYKALTYVHENHVHKCVICTDSLSVFTALQSPSSTHPTVTDIQEVTHRLITAGSEIIILWIPGHCGIKGNESADAQARGAVQSDHMNEVDMGPKEYYPILKLAMRNLFDKQWREYNPNTTLKAIKDKTGNWDSCRRNNRRQEIVLCRMRLGHTRYTHGHLLDRESRPECDHCDCPQSIHHLLVECPELATQRQPLESLCQTCV